MSEERSVPLPAAQLPEGEEQPPPGTRAMAAVRWGLVGLMAVAAVSAWVYHASTAGVLSQGQHRFHCPMHPSVVMERKGECPICGMDLVPVDGAAAPKADAPRPAAAPSHTCPMHPAFVTADPNARCPDCGMKLVARTPAAAGPSYTCPMHPAFVTADPKARCPDCGMKLVPREPAAASAGESSGVPGLADVELTVDRIQLIGMKTAPARRAPLAQSLRTVGFVTATENGLVSLNTRYSGWVDALGPSETGQLVERGTILATVYSPEMVNAQQVFLNTIRWSERRGVVPTAAQPLAPGQTDPDREARIRLEQQGMTAQDIDQMILTGQPLRSVNVRAPVRGYIARRSVLQGVYVQAGTEIFQIADLSTVWVLADVYEGEIGRVRVGQKADLSLAAWPGEVFHGKVQFIYPALNPGSRTLQARIEFRNPGLKLRPGMYGDVAIETDAAVALVIPRDALVDTGDLQYVYVDRGLGRFSPRRVEVGPASEGKVAVLRGLSEGERVVTTANFLLDSESRLRAALEGGGHAEPDHDPDHARAGERRP